jgi:hypothetical protein
MRHLGMFLVVFGILAHGLQRATAQTERGATAPIEIRGQVVYQPTQRPLKDVVVRLERVDYSFPTMVRTAGQGTSELLAVTKTDSQGRFVLRTHEKGRYNILCFRPGPYSGSGALNVDPAKFVVIQYRPNPKPFTLRPGENPPSRTQ